MARAKKTEKPLKEPEADVNEPAEAVQPEVAKEEPKDEPDNAASDKKAETSGKQSKLKRWAHTYWQKKKITLPLTVLLLLVVLMAIPLTRYSLLGLFIKKDYVVTLEDSRTHSIVSGAKVTMAGQQATTNTKGVATVHVALGSHGLTVTKQYYQTFNGKKLVSLSQSKNQATVELVAQGRQVPVKVVDKVTGKPVANARLSVLDTEASTDKDGTATVVLPTTGDTQKATITADNYNKTDVTITVTDQQSDKNNFTMVPSGTVYFLSNATGKIDVVKSNLDGSNRQTVLAGTGKEEKFNTILLASRDWKYLALLSKRDGSANAKLYVINTSNDQLTTVDEGDASFTLTGWSNHDFVYRVNRLGLPPSDPHQQAIKGYNAENNKLSVIDEVAGTLVDQFTYLTENYGEIYIVNDKVWFSKSTQSTFSMQNHDNEKASISIANTDGSNKQKIKAFDTTYASRYNFVGSVFKKPGDILVEYSSGGQNSYYEYRGNQLLDSTADTYINGSNDNFTYLLSPSGQKTFWGEPRDGKTTLFIGDANGDNGKQIASLSEFKPFGWYSDNYLLVQKKDSELYIMAGDGSGTPLKLSDYYKPAVNFEGYGGGYGGL